MSQQQSFSYGTQTSQQQAFNQQRQQRIRAICLMPHLLLEKGVKYKKQGGINSPCPVVLKRARRRDNSPNPLWDLGSTLTRAIGSLSLRQIPPLNRDCQH